MKNLNLFNQRVCLPSVIVASFMLPDFAFAQAKSTTLEEIVITAQRREETTQNSALSVTALSGADLMRDAKSTIAEAIETTPSVSIQNTAQGGQVYIRGVGTNGDGNWIDSAVSLMFDNVYTGRSESLGGSAYDIDRVEVLRGPQGTLYGRNATGGTVNILTNKPNTDDFEGQINTRLGNFNLTHVDAALNLPVSESFAVRIAGLNEERDGYFSNNGQSSDVTGVRAKFLWDASKNIKIVGGVDYFRQQGDLLTTVQSIGYDPASTAPFVPAWDVEGDAWTVDKFHPADVIDYEFTTYSLQLDWDLGFARLTAIPSYTKSNRHVFTDLWTGTFFGSVRENEYEENQYTTEVRLSSNDDSDLKWVAGVYLLDSENYDITQGSSSLNNGYYTLGEQQPTTSEAVFGQATYSITDNLRITAGLRYTKDEKGISFGVKSLPLEGYGTYSTGIDRFSSGQKKVTYKLGFEYDMSEDSLLYGHVSTGYKASGFGTSTFPPVSYEPEELIAFEFGSKNIFLDSTLQLNAAAYYYDYDNYQVQVAVSGPPAQENTLYAYLKTLPEFADVTNLQGYVDAYLKATEVDITGLQFTQYVLNAKTGKNYGIELDTRYLLTDNDEVSFQYSNTHARYGEFDTSLFPGLSATSGKEVANAPIHAGSLAYEHTFPFENSGAEFAVRAESKISGGYWTTVGSRGQANDWQKSFTRSNLTATYRSAGDMTVSLWVRNIENEAQTVMVGPSALARRVVTNPRTYGVNFSYSF